MLALNTAATGMMAQQLNVQVISNNIANMRTTGFKRQRAEFQDMLYEQMNRVGTQTSDNGTEVPAGIELGTGVKTTGTPRIMTQGNLLPTGNQYDLAVNGEGFFKIQLPDGTYAYTRDGSFNLDSQGRLVTAEGYLVQPTITIPANTNSVTINQQGQVSVTTAGSTTPTTIGQLQLTVFMNKAGLQGMGNNLFLETPASGTPQDATPGSNGYGTVMQGNLEQANVQPVSEISDLIAAQRAYEMNAKVITAADQMLSDTSNLMR